MNSSGPELNEEQNVHRFLKKRFDREKVTRQNLVFVVCHQVTPTRGTSTVWCWWNVVTPQDIGDCLVTDGVAEFGEFTLNSVVAPVRILSSFPCRQDNISPDEETRKFLGSKSDNQTFKHLIDPWSTVASAGIVCSFAFHQLSMPANDCLRLEDVDDLT
jgi:hypothetical protein